MVEPQCTAPLHNPTKPLIALAVRWYIRYRLSYADVVEWFAERGLVVDRSTIYRWVQRFLPLFQEATRPHRQPVGVKWRVDETYTRLQRKWACLYRALDQHGQVVDTYFLERRNAKAAQAFFERAITATGVSATQVTTDSEVLSTSAPPGPTERGTSVLALPQ